MVSGILIGIWSLIIPALVFLTYETIREIYTLKKEREELEELNKWLDKDQ